MSSVVISGDTSGAITLSAPAVAGTNTATLPAATGTVMVSGNMPAFSAYANASQSVSSGVVTKVQFQTKDFDTATAFDNTTNYRFLPLVAGYYQINSTVRMSGTIPTNYDIYLYKNGSSYRTYLSINISSGSTTLISSIGAVIYLNGSTDYLEVYADITATSPTFSANTTNTSSFSGSLIRSA